MPMMINMSVCDSNKMPARSVCISDANAMVREFNRSVKGGRVNFLYTSRGSFTLFSELSIEPAPVARIIMELASHLYPEKYKLSITHGRSLNIADVAAYYTDNQQLVDNNHHSSDAPEFDNYGCALKGQVMDYPVKLPDGSYVERKEIAEWLSSNDTNPITGERMDWDKHDIEGAIDYGFKQEIENYIFKLLSAEYVSKINEMIRLEDIHEPGYMRFEANPYGHDKQKYMLPYSNVLFKTSVTQTSRTNQGVLVSKYEQEITLRKLNYPHHSKTEAALQDLIFAMKTKNTDKFSSIISCYPVEAGKILFKFASLYAEKYNFENNYVEECPPRPVEDNYDYYAIDPHREERGFIKPLFVSPNFR